MIPNIEIFLFFALVVLSFIDIFTKHSIPSPLTTGVLLVSVLLGGVNVQLGIVGFLVALLMMEMEVGKGGVADLKLLTAISFASSSLNTLLMFFLFYTILGLAYKVSMKKIFKARDDIAFIPIIALAYLTTLIVQYSF